MTAWTLDGATPLIFQRSLILGQVEDRQLRLRARLERSTEGLSYEAHDSLRAKIATSARTTAKARSLRRARRGMRRMVLQCFGLAASGSLASAEKDGARSDS